MTARPRALCLAFLLTATVLTWHVPPAAAQPGESSQQQQATGVVYHDQNENGQRDPGEPGLADIRVSNGVQIVHTDQQGRYRLPVTSDTILFVIKPRNWRTPVDSKQLPQFYYIHKPDGSPQTSYPGVDPTGPLPESVDFALYPQDEPDQFKAILFGDPQPRNQREVEFIGHDVVRELIGTDASFGVTLGDIVFDNLALFESQARTIALIGIPWYNVIGNHDMNYDVQDDRHSDETFERHFGPSYYSFDYGPVHFLVLDDVQWRMDESSGKPSYRGGLGPEQMQFIENDLARVPENQLIVLMMHIPLVQVHDRHQLYRLIEQRPFCLSISAHRHFHQHRFIGSEDGWRGPERHHHVVNVTVSGSWWSGQKDERGIPHTLMSDGAPNGYSIISFDGHDYQLDFRAAGRPADYQMNIYFPDQVAAGALAEVDVLVNVFNGSERSKVCMRVSGESEWLELERVDQVDPAFVDVAGREEQIREHLKEHPEVLAQTGLTLPRPSVTNHIWQGRLDPSLAPGTYLLEVETADMHGRRFTDGRVFRVVD